ncbi:MAG: hypothetical protein M2R45_00546 [Verrucomicrobia subdivision 3 bacterium]|nr:hypothetical protein [Limisphaerales bacterium]MCS1413576.1 hypothetical protein [Limisphaerales bacterium]
MDRRPLAERTGGKATSRAVPNNFELSDLWTFGDIVIPSKGEVIELGTSSSVNDVRVEVVAIGRPRCGVAKTLYIALFWRRRQCGN